MRGDAYRSRGTWFGNNHSADNRPGDPRTARNLVGNGLGGGGGGGGALSARQASWFSATTRAVDFKQDRIVTRNEPTIGIR